MWRSSAAPVHDVLLRLIFVDGDGAVGGVQGDFGAAARAVAAFEVGVAALGGGFLQRVGLEFGVDVTGVAVGDDLEVGVLGHGDRDSGGRVGDVNVVLWRRREAQLD